MQHAIDALRGNGLGMEGILQFWRGFHVNQVAGRSGGVQYDMQVLPRPNTTSQTQVQQSRNRRRNSQDLGLLMSQDGDMVTKTTSVLI